MSMKAPLRRRTGQILASLLVLCLVFAAIAAIPATCADPSGAFAVAGVAAGLAAALTRALDEGLGTFAMLTAVFVPLGLGLYGLHVVFGLSVGVIFWIGAALAGLVVVLVGRALVASGSADYPYDE